MFAKAFRKLGFLRGTNLKWRKPERAEVAILDEVGSDEIVEILPNCSFHVVDLSGRTTNVWALARALAKGRSDQFGYTVEYLRMVNPRIAVTMIDTTPFFYRLKEVFPTVTTIAIQNGWRGFEVARDLQAETKALSVDHLFCFGEVARGLYQQSISGTFHITGSFRSNKVPVQLHHGSRTVALISTLRGKVRLDDQVRSYVDRPEVSYATIFERRLLLASYVADFCRKNSLKLLVLGKEQDDDRERSLYESVFDDHDVEWEFSPRSELLSNYRHLNEARIAISTSSSLGYEALGRGVRTAFFMLDPEVTGNFGDKFGWPGSFNDEGTIWVNYLDREMTLKILQHLHEMSDEEWLCLRQNFVPKLISSDSGNTVLRKIIQTALKDNTTRP